MYRRCSAWLVECKRWSDLLRLRESGFVHGDRMLAMIMSIRRTPHCEMWLRWCELMGVRREERAVGHQIHRWASAQKAGLVERWHESGLNRAEFCCREGICCGSFHGSPSGWSGREQSRSSWRDWRLCPKRAEALMGTAGSSWWL